MFGICGTFQNLTSLNATSRRDVDILSLRLDASHQAHTINIRAGNRIDVRLDSRYKGSLDLESSGWVVIDETVSHHYIGRRGDECLRRHGATGPDKSVDECGSLVAEGGEGGISLNWEHSALR